MRSRALDAWHRLTAAAGLALLAAVAWTAASNGFAAWLHVVGASFVVVSFAALWPIVRAGRAPDWVTLARLVALVATWIAVWAGDSVGWFLWSTLVAIALADLADGWVARRSGGSDAGAILDMEADQLVFFAFAIIAIGAAGAPAWTIALPGIRWAWVVIAGASGVPVHDPKPQDGDNRRARLICALVVVLYLTALLPELESSIRTAAVAVAVAMLAFSYASDAVFFWRRRARLDERERV